MTQRPLMPRLPSLRPGDPLSCPFCGDRVASVMPGHEHMPGAGYWASFCIVCGQQWLWRPHFGDREQDLLWVVDPAIPADDARRHRERIAAHDWRGDPYARAARRTLRRWRRAGLL